MEIKDYEIKRVDRKTCEEFLKDRHYLSLQGCSFRSGNNYDSITRIS